jgi:imidazolonepropionase-like amidohydrolase
VGGPAFGLKSAIDSGIIAGPRIFPSGAFITVTSGHGDFRQPSELPRTIGGMLSRMEQIGGRMVADSPDEVRLRVREQLMQGASQIKLTAGGGVSSPFSPIDVSTFTEAELRAAVEAAENWGTYVTVHAFTPAAIQRSIAAGVKCIEHGFLMDEATAKLIAQKGIWLSLQPLPEGLREGFPQGSVQRAKADEVWPGIARAYELAKKYKIKTAWGTDVLFSQALAQQQGAILASLVRWYSPAEALAMATGTNAELLALSGKRNPYPGKLGVVEQGALADLLLVDGNPLENINLVADPAKNFGSSGESVGGNSSRRRVFGVQQESVEFSTGGIEGTLFGLSDERIHERSALVVEELGEHALDRPPSQWRVLVQATDDLAAQGA